MGVGVTGAPFNLKGGWGQGHSGRRKTATRRRRRNEERVTAQGPVTKQQPNRQAHGNAVRHVLDDQNAEESGQQKPGNDPGTNQHTPGAPTTGLR